MYFANRGVLLFYVLLDFVDLYVCFVIPTRTALYPLFEFTPQSANDKYMS